MMGKKWMKLGKDVSLSSHYITYCPQESTGIMESGLDMGTNIHQLMNGIRCDKLSIPITAIHANPDRYEWNFKSVMAYLSQYVDFRRLKNSLCARANGQERP